MQKWHATQPTSGRFRLPRNVRLAIYRRDEWTCQLCTEPVDPKLMDSDPLNDWAPSLDHIDCQSWGVRDHSPENLRLAHRWCNSVRGDETYYTAADLVA
jgi:5-methylcytosine-specific restriction endonuclease McrA